MVLVLPSILQCRRVFSLVLFVCLFVISRVVLRRIDLNHVDSLTFQRKVHHLFMKKLFDVP